MFFSEEYTVQIHDADVNDRMLPSAVLRYMQETANHNMYLCKPSYSELIAEGKSFVLSRIAVQNHAPLHPYERIRVETWAIPSRGFVFPRYYRIIRGDTLISEGASAWGLIDMETKRLLKGTDVDLSAYTYGEPLELSARFLLPKELPFETVGEHKVPYSQIDVNRHMNNTHYPNLLADHIPHMERKWVRSFQINFRGEAPYGETIRIERAKLPREDGTKCYGFRTKVGELDNVEAQFETEYRED